MLADLKVLCVVKISLIFIYTVSLSNYGIADVESYVTVKYVKTINV